MIAKKHIVLKIFQYVDSKTYYAFRHLIASMVLRSKNNT